MSLLLVFLALFSPTAHAQDIQFSSTTAPIIIEAYATKYGIPAQPLIDTLSCESKTANYPKGFDPEAIGDKGLARGIAQIRSDYFPDITDAEAFNPLFSINFAAKEFAAGHASWWSCYNKLYKGVE